MDREQFGRALRIAREQAGFTRQDEAARAAQVKASTLSKWETGGQEPRALSLIRVLGAWEVSLAEFESIALALEGKLGPYAELRSEVSRVAETVERHDLELQTGVRLPDRPKGRRPEPTPRRGGG